MKSDSVVSRTGYTWKTVDSAGHTEWRYSIASSTQSWGQYMWYPM